ncbi:MAG: glycosyltransferase family 39 protein [bacterium]
MPRQTRDVWLVALGFLALHLVAAALIALIADESYYTLWTSGLDWDYYDHPPMIAVFISGGIDLIGLSPLGVRLISLLAMAGATVLTADMARHLGGNPQVQRRAALYFNLSVVVLTVGGFATPDAPSTVFWTLSCWAAMRAASGHATRWWLLAGFAAGLGVMSKFTNLFLGLGYVGWLAFTAQGRRSLRSPAPYLGILAALVPVVPLILWNISHHGLGFERQFGRIAESGFSPIQTLGYLALLIVLPTPVIAYLAARQATTRNPGPAKAMLLWTLAPLLAYFLIHSLHSAIPGNWLIPVSAAVAVLAAQGAERASLTMRRLAIGIAAVMSIGSAALLFNPWLPVGLADNPPNQTRGWPQFLAQIPPDGWIATVDYALTGQLWTSFPGRSVWSVAELERYGFRGPFPRDLCNATGWLVEEAHVDPARAEDYFDHVGPVIPLSRVFAGETLKTYHLRAVSGVKVTALCPAN